jgi:hypothetical protein
LKTGLAFFQTGALLIYEMKMRAKLLEKCREYLEQEYRGKLGIDFSGSIDRLKSGRQPVWRFVSSEDLISEIQPDSPSAAGLLLDPEIGLLTYFLPFSPASDLRTHLLCALALRSRLAIEAARNAERLDFDTGDIRGAWRVVQHWLVEAEDEDAWTRQVAEVRRENRFSEEVPLDAIFLDPKTGLENQLRCHGFPRLLLTVRELFKRHHRLDDFYEWMSAEDQVKQALADFPSRFEAPEQRDLAEEILREMASIAEKGGLEKLGPLEVREFERFRVQNFRNLRDVTLDFGEAPVSANVVCGPNGTGKSSLCEAFSLALFRSSSRYKAFVDRAEEKDVTVTDRTREYLARYVAPLGGEPNDGPKVAFDDEPLLAPELVPPVNTGEAETAMSGTILPQSQGQDFARMSAQDLGALILRGYSELADRAEEYADRRFAESNENRRAFLSSLGLSTSITRLSTALERVVRREIDRSLPALPKVLMEWLEAVPSGTQLSLRWHDWGSEPSRNAVAAQLAAAGERPASLQEQLEAWLGEFNRLIALSSEMVKDVGARMGPLRQELDQAGQRIATWGEWLERNPAGAGAVDSAGADPLAAQLQALLQAQQRVVEEGRSAARHLEHLTQVEAYLRESWSKEHADQCPTCGADHSERGGILAVNEALRNQTAAQRDGLRREYGRLKKEIEKIQGGLARVGGVQCPITPDEQSRLAESLSWLLPPRMGLQQWISVRNQREDLLASLAVLKQRPALPQPVDVQAEAERVAGELQWLFYDARRMFEAPRHWKPVKEALTAVLADVVSRHLPNTLAALWSELYLNLTSAPWLLPERPAIEVMIRRGEKRSTLQVKGRLARYILNQSETHILGLGWFFTRYLANGRFFHPCMIMDDPAHEMDESTFRDLCRLWETLVRLHRVYELPLKLVILLNQESRAIEAARATGGVLMFLGWTPVQEGKLVSTRLMQEDVSKGTVFCAGESAQLGEV